jgi:hypothetical protein
MIFTTFQVTIGNVEIQLAEKSTAGAANEDRFYK